MGLLSEEEVRRLARLSRIHLNEDEVESLRKELGAILEYVKQLQSVDTKNVETTAQVTGLENVMRPDEEIDYGTDRKSLLSNAPAKEKGYIKVRRVLEGNK